jgi:hypothetical protein
MEKKHDLSYYTQLKYDIIIRNHDNLYYLVIPELSLIVESENLSDAYEKLEEKKKQLFSDMMISESEDVINEPRSKVIKKSFFSELPVFCIKIMIVFFVCISLLGVIFIGTLPLANSLVTGIPIKAAVSARAFVIKVNTKLTNLTDDQKQKLRIQFRTLLQEIKPFIDDTKIVFAEKNDKKLDHIVPSKE